MKSRITVATFLAQILWVTFVLAEEGTFLGRVFGPQPEVQESVESERLRTRVFRDEIAGRYHIEAGVLKGSDIQIPADSVLLVKGIEMPGFVPSKEKQYFIGKVTPRGVSVNEVHIQVDGGHFDKAIVNIRGGREGKSLEYDATQTSVNLFEIEEINGVIPQGSVNFHCIRIFVH